MSGQQGGDDKNSMAALWLIAGVFMIAAVIWIAFAEQLKMFFIFLRRLELTLIYWTVCWIPFMSDTAESVKNALQLMKMVKGSSLTMQIADSISTFVGEFLRWPFSLLLAGFTYMVYMRNIKMRYKKRYDMERLAAQECSEWPQINPILNTNLVQQDLDEGQWAMAMPPVLFCKKNKLLKVSIDTSGDMFRKGEKFKAELLEDRAEQVFINQLGRLWHDPESMPMYRRALFAAFIARGCRDAAAKKLIIQMNHSCRGGELQNLDFTGVDELWKKHYPKREVQEVIQVHAYEFTIFTALYLFARMDGVFPCSDFLWLKPTDRRFWYVLNNVGRQTPYCEAAGVYAHFLAEKSLRRKLSTPVVGCAVSALKSALGDIVYIPGNEEKDALYREAAAAAEANKS